MMTLWLKSTIPRSNASYTCFEIEYKKGRRVIRINKLKNPLHSNFLLVNFSLLGALPFSTMYYYKTKILYLWLLAALQTHATHIGQNNTDRSVQDCPLSGPSFPAAFDLSKSKTFAHAQDYFRSGLRDEFCSGSLNETDLVFTIDIFSTVTNSSVFSYHHVGKNLKDIVAGGELNDSTISRIGSVSKLFTAYSILAAGGIKVFNDPVTKYLPELKSNKSNDPITNIAWDDITVGALASQQGGTAGVRKFSFHLGLLMSKINSNKILLALELFNCPPNTGNCTIPG